ncbi:MAG: hypothetical protein WC749_07715 [Dehalococcoidia bacterium]
MSVLTVGTTALALVPANAARQNIYIRNNSAGGQVAYVDMGLPTGLSTTNCGYVLAAGDWISFNVRDDGNDLRQPWSVVASAAGASIVYQEMASSRKQLAEEAISP